MTTNRKRPRTKLLTLAQMDARWRRANEQQRERLELRLLELEVLRSEQRLEEAKTLGSARARIAEAIPTLVPMFFEALNRSPFAGMRPFTTEAPPEAT